ncbi:MAG: hypothetical protein K6T75_04180 [Acetobacteraceae bacterium]|nr:hypothetical protein [Acetobacteraceae bacterium]
MESVDPRQLLAPLLGLLAVIVPTVRSIIGLSVWLQTHYRDKATKIMARVQDSEFSPAVASLWGLVAGARRKLSRGGRPGGSVEEVVKHTDLQGGLLEAAKRVCSALRRADEPHTKYETARRAFSAALSLFLGGELAISAWLFFPKVAILWSSGALFAAGFSCGLAGLLTLSWLVKRAEDMWFTEGKGPDHANRSLSG